jgi:hypothetical protein
VTRPTQYFGIAVLSGAEPLKRPLRRNTKLPVTMLLRGSAARDVAEEPVDARAAAAGTVGGSTAKETRRAASAAANVARYSLRYAATSNVGASTTGVH